MSTVLPALDACGDTGLDATPYGDRVVIPHAQTLSRSSFTTFKTLLATGLISACLTNADNQRLLGQGVGAKALTNAVDLDGKLRRPGEAGDTKCIVFSFLSTECPISNSYLPLLNELSSRYRRQGIEFYGVISDPAVTRREAIEHSEAYKVSFPVLFDGSGKLRLALSPTHTPQAIVVSDSGKMLYSGAIDDRYVKLGKKKDVANRDFLQLALQSVVDDQPIALPKTTPIGCPLEDPPNKTQSGSVTYTRDIAPIIQANCVCCHRPNQSGPFELLTYEDVSGHARQIIEVTQSGFMPPWKPSTVYPRFQDEQRLTKHELDLLSTWVEMGKPQGDPADLPASPAVETGWRLGEPDKVLEMSEVFPIPASGPDIRQYFVIPTRLTENRLISAVDFQPGTPQAVHHASFFLDGRRVGRHLDEADPSPGYSGFGGPQFESQGTLSSWFPGMAARPLPDGMGRWIPRGADIVAEIHYVCTGKPERDRSKIGIYYAKRSARQVVVELQVGEKRLEILAGEKRHLETADYTLPVDTTLLDIVPHMHVLGREIKVLATQPDGAVKPLLWIKDWDFNWQGQYAYAEPVELPKGTKISVQAWYDNSSDNPLNPNSPPRTVYWGSDSTDEMLICNFQCTCKTMQELKELQQHQRRYIARNNQTAKETAAK
ncbi:redoxin domain-containing protein [Stieleria sp. TO1_6]|uniref:redoxin domain-containing protein n=1 Tax=Stieleria tagensis TaxID=2956795 RepID=UPI00209B4FD3|nr:redoxin domain-containing protein [Stieleria tagensis]MCO8125175.1 redoxin domain-containing protein [Stieleria tagensis]